MSDSREQPPIRPAMGKSVVGIFAVALIQVAFLGYTAIDKMRNAVINEVEPPVRPGHELARLVDTPEFDVRTVELIESRRSRRVHLSSSGRSQTRYSNRQRPYQSSFKSLDSIASTTIIQSGPGIPSGYSMVLVDYSPDVLVDGKPREIRFR